jgi:hypothetical protein
VSSPKCSIGAAGLGKSSGRSTGGGALAILMCTALVARRSRIQTRVP